MCQTEAEEWITKTVSTAALQIQKIVEMKVIMTIVIPVKRLSNYLLIC